MNPRRPTPAGPQPAPFDQTRATPVAPVLSAPNGLQQDEGQEGAGLAATLQGFLEWCRGHASDKTCSQYARRVEEILHGEAEPGKSRWHITAWKRYSRWRCEELGEEQWCSEFKRWKTRKSRPDIYVPGDDEVARALRAPEPWGTLYRLLLESGLRLREVVRIVNEIDSLRTVELDGFVRVELAWYRGSKKAYWGYFLEQPPRLGVSYEAAEKIPQRLGTLPWKYMRKYVATKLVELECPEIAIDFIQGRAETTILRKNYAQILAAADKCYKRYAEWLRNNLLGLNIGRG